MKPQKKHFWSLKKGVGAVILVVLAIWVVYSVLNAPPTGTTATSSASSSASAANTFEVNGFSTHCGIDPQTGVFVLSVNLSLTNAQNIQYHYDSATVELLKISLSNGQNVTVNQQIFYNTPAYGGTYQIPTSFKIGNFTSIPPMTHAWYIITPNVREVAQPNQVPFRILGCSIG